MSNNGPVTHVANKLRKMLEKNPLPILKPDEMEMMIYSDDEEDSKPE